MTSGDAPLSVDARQALLVAEREQIDRALESIVANYPELDGLELSEPMRYALDSRGKRIRPILCLLAWRAVRGKPQPPAALYRLCCAVEIVHTYSLVHDDLPCMDDDDLRRGRPTLHRVFGAPRATIAGAALLALAVCTLLREGETLGLDQDRSAELVRELCLAAGAEGMVGGQLLDLAGERARTDADRLEAIHRAKTGSLLIASLRIGAIAAGADEELLAALTAYGASLGLAFQIADDILDVVGDAATLGKRAGRDEELSKASYPALFGLEGARQMARARADEARAALGRYATPELVAMADYMVERES